MKKIYKIFAIIVAVFMLTSVMCLSALAHGNGNGDENGLGHRYDDGIGAGPGNGNGYGHNGLNENSGGKNDNAGAEIDTDSDDYKGSGEQVEDDNSSGEQVEVSGEIGLVIADTADTAKGPETDITGEDTPLTAAPEATADETLVIAPGVPLDASPNTGDVSYASVLWIMLVMSLAGLTVMVVTGKRTEG